LDPRCRSLKHLSSIEKKEAKSLLVEEVKKPLTTKKILKAQLLSPMSERICMILIYLTHQLKIKLQKRAAKMKLCRTGYWFKVHQFRRWIIVVSPEKKPCVGGEKKIWIPHRAVLAWKWLSVTATSTPLERVFSGCGWGLTAK
jgi:hypothetical protein